MTQKQQDEVPPSQDYFEVRVKRGDFLEKIARANGTTVDEIKKINHLNSEKISVGQLLRIPKKGEKETAKQFQENSKTTPTTATPSTADSKQKTVAEAEIVYYTVKKRR